MCGSNPYGGNPPQNPSPQPGFQYQSVGYWYWNPGWGGYGQGQPSGQSVQPPQYPGGQRGQPPPYPGDQPGPPAQYQGGQPQVQPTPAQNSGQTIQPTEDPGRQQDIDSALTKIQLQLDSFSAEYAGWEARISDMEKKVSSTGTAPLFDAYQDNTQDKENLIEDYEKQFEANNQKSKQIVEQNTALKERVSSLEEELMGLSERERKMAAEKETAEMEKETLAERATRTETKLKEVYQLYEDKTLIEWVPSTPQHAPSLSKRAIVAGPDADGSPLWVIRARFQGDHIPGKLAVKHHAAYVPWAGKENFVQQFEVCCCDHPERIRWIADQDGRVPPNAIRGGTTTTGDNLFIGRARHDQSVTPGKIHQTHHAMYISFGGKEVSYKWYEVLCRA